MKKSELNREKFAKRLEKALSLNGKVGWGSGAYLKEVTGVTQKAASKWINGESIPNKEKIIAISKALNINSSWLEYGEGEITSQLLSNNQSNLKDLKSESANSYYYPVIEWDDIESFIDGRLSSEKIMRIVMSPKKVEKGFWLDIKDDFMSCSESPSFPKGSCILVDPNFNTLENGKLLLLKLANGNTTFRRVVKSSTTSYLKSLNEKYLPEPFDDSKCQVLGKIVGVSIEVID